MPAGLILTMGLSPEPLIFSIQKLQADFVIFIGTSESLKASVDATVEQTGLKPSQYDKLTIKDSPDEIGALCEVFQHAKTWLEDQGATHIVSDPTGGRKWMSAGAVMVASFLGIPMMYVDVRTDNEKKVILDSMRMVELGNAYDQTGFIVASKGRDAFNAFDFGGAAYHFGQISPTHAHKKELFQGLHVLCQQLARWDRFEHYGAAVSRDISSALEQVERALRSGAGSPELAAFSDQMKAFAAHLESMEGTSKLSVDFIADIYLNAGRCIQRNRFDDAVARHYRTLEAVSQFCLAEYGIVTDSPDYAALNETQLNLFRSVCRGKVEPDKIDLKLGFWMLRVFEHSIMQIAFAEKSQFSYKSFAFEGILKERNESILAHGFKPIGQTRAEKFHTQLQELLQSAFGDAFGQAKQALQLPHLPPLGF
ncbi:MAG: TIGR02710 family CRISPR-associated CARF protein [Bacteroidia bacterium]|nr:TIGR02710 family CRISPR-associated CARF protein [Bacteroidia bacterium]